MKYLLEISSKCHESGIEFLGYLKKLMTSSTSSKPLRIAGATIKFHYSRHKIEDFRSRLESLRGSLILASIVAFRTRATSGTEEVLKYIKSLDERNKNEGKASEQLAQTLRTLVEILRDQTNAKLGLIREQTREHLQQFTEIRKKLRYAPEQGVLNWLYFRQLTWRFEDVPLAYQKTFQ